MTQVDDNQNFSIHTNGIVEIHEIPFSIINRPIPSTLEEEKVCKMMSILKDDGKKNELTPIDVLWVEIPEKGNYYFAFGGRLFNSLIIPGCHRYEAYKRLGLSTVRAKIMKVHPSVIRDYLGSSSPF